MNSGQSRNGASSRGFCQKRGGNGSNGGNGGSSDEESVDLGEVAKTLKEVAKKVGELAKSISSAADQDDDLRQKAVQKLREVLSQVVSGAGSELDLACLLRCVMGVSAAAMKKE